MTKKNGMYPHAYTMSQNIFSIKITGLCGFDVSDLTRELET